MPFNSVDRTAGQSDLEGPVMNFARPAAKMYQRIALIYARQLNGFLIDIKKAVCD